MASQHRHRSRRGSSRNAAPARLGSTGSPEAPQGVSRTASMVTADTLSTLLAGGLLALAVLWIYAPVCDPRTPAEWLWDDDQLLTANATVQSTTPSALLRLWLDPEGTDYFPLTSTALWLQWAAFGPRATGYHVVSVLLHLASSLLLWRLLDRLGAAGARLAAVLFAVHPVCVESVAWVSELKNTLSLPLFLLAATHAVTFDTRSHAADPITRRSAEPHYWASLVLFLLAMLAKTSVVMLPVVLLLHAWWKRGVVMASDIVRAAPFFLVSLVLGLVTIAYQHGRAIGAEAIPVGGLDSRTATAGLSILWYLRLIAWPVHLLPIYPRWEVDPPSAWQFLAWLPILGGLWWCWRHRDAAGPAGWEHWGRHALFAFGFFLLMLLPVLGFVTIAYMRITWAADHFIYLPMIGPLALLAAGLVTGARRLPARTRPLQLGWVAGVVVALAVLARGYAGVWVDEDALWTHTLRHNPAAWQAHNRLGARQFARGETEAAHAHFVEAVRLRPDLGETHNNLGTTLSARGHVAEAIEAFREGARVSPQTPAIRVNLAAALVRAGRFAEASRTYEQLVAEQPDTAPLLHNYGVSLYREGRRADAIVQFRRALALAPQLQVARESLALALRDSAPVAEPPGPGAAASPAPPSPP